jgi:hypothetical protein
MASVSRFIHQAEKTRTSCLAGAYVDLEAAEEAVRLLDAARFPIGQLTIICRNPEGPGLLLTGSLALMLFGSVEAVVSHRGAVGWLRQLMAWGLTPRAIDEYERRVQTGRAVLIAHGSAPQTARARRLLTGKGALALQVHPKSPTEWEEAILRG